ncbi:eukaryotic translation initiation factor 2-alpha kinase [Thecaphora frezii]
MPSSPQLPALSPEEIAEIQQTEIEALQSILEDDFRKIEQKAWKNAQTSQLHELEITLRPDEERLKPLVAAIANVKLPKNYPLNAPTITFKHNDGRNRGLSAQHIADLGAELNAKARELVGAEMIWELVSHGQDFISRNNQAPSEAKHGLPSVSLEEEKRQRALDEERREQQRRDEDRRKKKEVEAAKTSQLAQLIQQEASKKAMVLKKERERQRTLTSSSLELAAGTNGTPKKESLVPNEWLGGSLAAQRIETFLEPFEDYGRVISILRIGPVLERTELSVRHLAESGHDDPSDTTLASSWILEHYFISSIHYAYSAGKRKIEEVEWELDKLVKIRDPNLVNVLASAVTRMGDQRGWKLSVVLERTSGVSLRSLLEQCEVLPWRRVRSYLASALEALEALHSRNLLHRSVCIDCIYVERSAAASSETKMTVRIRDACYVRRLRDMHRSSPLNENAGPLLEEEPPQAWRAPESIEQPLSYTRKRDLWDLGVCACQMLFGIDCRIEHEAPEHLLRSADELPPHVQAFLMLMLERSPKKRPTTAALASRLEEIVLFEDQEWSQESNTRMPGGKQGPGAPRISITRRRGNSMAAPASPKAELGTSPPRDGIRPGSFWPLRQMARQPPPQGGGVSRYLSDFEEVEFLGKGAFGSVVKARNRLDGRFYAVKKIKLSSSPEEDERTLREITALSRLDHPHVVRYTTCWIEETQTPIAGLHGSDTDGTTASRTLETNTTSATGPSGPSLASVKEAKRGAKQARRGDSFGAVPNFDSDFLSMDDDHDPFSQSNSFADIRFANDDSSDDDDDSVPDASTRPRSRVVITSPSCSDDSEGDSDDSDDSNDSDDSDDHEDSDDCSSSNDEEEDDFSRIRVGSRKSSRQGLSMSSMALSKVTTDFIPVQRVLYIQMEFVENRTLREAIDRGLSEDEAWRILRQMVEALAHISSLGIIHRDLKPSNVLMYANGDVKIGDFGLATNAVQIAEGGGGGTSGVADLGESADLTGDLGTFLYTAPELRAKKGARYNFKVDIYSLGIIFFEMLASQAVYRTGMERILLIRELRTPSVTFPSAWPRTRYEKQTTLIQQMLDHNPDRRPSPLEILRSDLLPPKMEDEYIEECLRLMANPSSAYNHQLMDALFGRTANDVVRDFTFDTGSQTDQDNALVGVVCDLIRSVCRKHGAVEFSAPLLVPPNGLYHANEKVVQMLDKTGKVVQLPYDLTVPFTRIVSRSDNQRFKRYEIGHVYRENVVAGGQPRAVLASSFDIVSPERSAAAEAEALAVVDELLAEIPGVASESWDIHINHESALSLILDRVPGKHREAVRGIVALLAGSRSIDHARSQLLQLGLPRSIIEELEAFNLQDELKTVHGRLERLFPNEHRSRVSKAVAEIAEVIATAQHFGVQRRFLFTPLLAQSSNLYKGGVFFTLVRAGKRRDVVAAGGRYDHLLDKFSNPSTSSASLHGVGVQIAVGKLTLGLAKYQEVHVPRLLSKAEEERSFGFMTPRRCDVYVASAPGLLHTRMEICRELWAHNISADLQYEHATYDSPESAAATCRSEGILLLVFVKARSPVLKVKLVLQRAEYEVSRHELISFVQDKIARQRSVDVQVAGAGWITSTSSRFHQTYGDTGFSRTGSSAGNAGGGSSFLHSHHHHHPSRAHAGSEVLPSMAIPVKEREMVLPERPIDRSKKGDKGTQNRPKPSSRQLVLDKASRQVSRFADQLQGGHVPILAVDFSGASFDRLAAALMACLASHGQHSGGSGGGGGGGGSTAGGDDGALLFRTFLEGLSAEEKDYARLIKAKAVEFAFPEAAGGGSGNNGGGGSGGGNSGGGGGGAQGCGRVFLYSLREDRTALVGCGR